MTIGVARVTLYLDGSQSLKDKRHVVRSITKRVQNQFNAAIAEVEDLDDMRVATLGITTISNSAPMSTRCWRALLDSLSATSSSDRWRG